MFTLEPTTSRMADGTLQPPATLCRAIYGTSHKESLMYLDVHCKKRSLHFASWIAQCSAGAPAALPTVRLYIDGQPLAS